MKKFFALLMTFAVLLGMTSCTSCNREKEQTKMDVEQIIKADLEYMANNYTCDYVWYEASMELENYIDAEDFDGSVASVTNIFQTLPSDSMPSRLVVFIEHRGELMITKEVHGLWVEDVVMTPDDLNLTYEQAWERMMEADCIKPHSIFVVLRNPLGPYKCNPQYIFGSANDYLLFADAVTGDVSKDNPAFNPGE